MPTLKILRAEAKNLKIPRWYKLNKTQLEEEIKKAREKYREEERKNKNKSREKGKEVEKDIIQTQNTNRPSKSPIQREQIGSEKNGRQNRQTTPPKPVQKKRVKKKNFDVFRNLLDRLQNKKEKEKEPVFVYQILYIPKKNGACARTRDFSGNISVGIFSQRGVAEDVLEEILNEEELFERVFLGATETNPNAERFSIDGQPWNDSYVIERVEIDMVSENFLKRMFSNMI